MKQGPHYIPGNPTNGKNQKEGKTKTHSPVPASSHDARNASQVSEIASHVNPGHRPLVRRPRLHHRLPSLRSRTSFLVANIILTTGVLQRGGAESQNSPRCVADGVNGEAVTLWGGGGGVGRGVSSPSGDGQRRRDPAGLVVSRAWRTDWRDRRYF